MHCILKRRGSGFASHAWLSQPWLGCEKRINQKIMDYGFKLASILQKVEESIGRVEDMNQLRVLAHECYSSISILKSLRHELDAMQQLGPEASQEDLMQDANRIMLKITATMIELGLCDAAVEVARTAKEICLHWSSYSSQRNVDNGNDELSEIEKEVPPRSQRISLAMEIVDGAHIITQRRLTAIGRLLYPLSLASKHLKGLASPYYEQSIALRKTVQGCGSSIDLDLGQEDFWVLGNSKQKSIMALGGMHRTIKGSP